MQGDMVMCVHAWKEYLCTFKIYTYGSLCGVYTWG